jgi:hypothetical protein
MLDQRAGGLPPVTIDIVREEIDSHIADPMIPDLTITRTLMELGYQNSQTS